MHKKYIVITSVIEYDEEVISGNDILIEMQSTLSTECVDYWDGVAGISTHEVTRGDVEE